MTLGKVTNINGTAAYVQLSREFAPRAVPLKAPKGATISIGDTVLCTQINGVWIILQVYNKE